MNMWPRKPAQYDRYRLLILLLCLALLAGCTKINAENYAKIHVGMTRHEVKTILGKPDDCSGIKTLVLSAQQCIWSAGKHQITINFVAGSVIMASASGL